MARNSGTKQNPFATFLIIGPTCFFLGILFAVFPYDYYVLWATPEASSAISASEYFDILERHLRFMHASPPLISRILNIAIATGFIGIFTKLYRPSEANVLFDGASLVLYVCGVCVYLVNIVKGLYMVTQGTYGEPLDAATAAAANAAAKVGEGGAAAVKERVLTREESLRVLAASNTILALVFIGVLVLQAGQWYAQKKESAEMEEMDKKSDEAKAKNAASKKKQ